MELYDIEVSGQESHGVPSFRAKFGRVTVILGANGTGKSRLLDFLRGNRTSNFGGPRPHVMVEGGRVVTLPDHIRLDQTTVDRYATYKQALQEHLGKRSGRITQRIKDALLVLERLEAEEKAEHSDAVAAWQRDGQQGRCPTRKETPLDRLFRLFNQTLPSIALVFERPNLYVKKGAARYQVSNMSDGEKQVLALLADIAMLAPEDAVIIVDEPELNLHPDLARQLWSTIEADRPGCIFIYATHSISFAMRQAVDCALVLAAEGSPVDLPNLAQVSGDDLRPFLGAVPTILRAKRAVVVEGDDSSFDGQFFRWILDDSATEVVAMGDSQQVIAATRRAGIWSRVAPAFQIVGVVDRDFRSDRQLAALASSACHVLEYHEAESYLCIPDVLTKIAYKVKLTEHLTSRQVVEEAILSFAREQLTRTAANRTAAQARLSLAVSVPRRAIAAVDAPTAIEMLRRAAADEVAKVGDAIDAEAVESIFRTELENCERAISARSIDDVLRIFPAKELLPRLARLAGLRDGQHAVLAARNHLSARDFEATERLRAKLAV